MSNVLILCINLQRSPERREMMEAEARRAGIDVTFVQAIDGTALSLDMAPGYDRRGRLQHAPDLKPNEVACVLSHKAALGTFLASDAPAAVVLEDDAVLSDRFIDFVEGVASLPIAWNAVNLENRVRKQLRPAVTRFDFGIGLHASAWLSWGATGWLYSRDGAERIVHSLRHFRHAYDTHMGLFWRNGVTALCADPPVVSSRYDILSTISIPGEERVFNQKELSLRQLLSSRRERIVHEIRKEIGARITLARLKIAVARAERPGTRPRRVFPAISSNKAS
jgi:glycosyl transferase, family 25